MKKLLLAILFIPLLLPGIRAQAQQLVKNISVHDPVMIRKDSVYYIFCTGPGIAVWSSKDRISWKPENPVFGSAPQWAVDILPGFKNHIWAPDISYYNGQYYLYYAVSAFGKNTSAIGLATNKTLHTDSPDFKWVDHGKIIQSVPGKTNWNAIDPNLVTDNDGTPYLFFGSFWDGLKVVKLNNDRLSIAENIDSLPTIASRKKDDSKGNLPAIDNNPVDAGGNAIEAPFVFKKGGFFYLFASIDYCCKGPKSDYKMIVGRSQQIRGPYLDSAGVDMARGGGTLVLAGDKNWYGVGHNAVCTFDGVDYLIFHGYDASDKGISKLRIEKLSWKEGWPEVVPATAAAATQGRGPGMDQELSNNGLTGNLFVHDPCMIKCGDTYYVFSTGMGMKSSKDMIHWTNDGAVFERDDPKPAWWNKDIPGRVGLWAPDIHYRNGKYYLYYSVSAWMNFNSSIGYATNVTLDKKDPRYKWEDQGQVINHQNGGDSVNVIDPNVFIDQDGKEWLIYGSYRTGLRLVELDPQTGKPFSATPVLDTITTSLGEGSYIIRGPEYYYVFASRGRCCAGLESTYQIVMGRSKTVTGPYLNKEGKSWKDNNYSKFLAGDYDEPGRGHNGFFAQGDTTYIVYHAYTRSQNGAPLLNIKPMYMDDEGWPTVLPTGQLFSMPEFERRVFTGK